MDVGHANTLDALEKGDLPAAQRAMEFHNAAVLADVRKRSDLR
jgi:DNA-binding GntR family transcriptional regulator